MCRLYFSGRTRSKMTRWAIKGERCRAWQDEKFAKCPARTGMRALGGLTLIFLLETVKKLSHFCRWCKLSVLSVQFFSEKNSAELINLCSDDSTLFTSQQISNWNSKNFLRASLVWLGCDLWLGFYKVFQLCCTFHEQSWSKTFFHCFPLTLNQRRR